jgi:hypothetical protein
MTRCFWRTERRERMKEQLITRDARGLIVKIVERELTAEDAAEDALLEAGRVMADRLLARADLQARCAEACWPLVITLPHSRIDNLLRWRLVDALTETLLARYPHGVTVRFQ